MTSDAFQYPHNVHQRPDHDLERRIEKLTKINHALMQRVERSMDHQANAYSMFQTAISLEGQVRIRTDELKTALQSLEVTNEELITARDTAERANRFKTRFFTAVGHDLLQPLHAARLSLSVLVDGNRAPDDQRIAHQIEHALTTVEELLKTILDISKLESGVMKPSRQIVGLADLFASLALDIGPLARNKNLSLTVRPTDLAVASDPLMLRRILQNLLANAVSYTHSGGIKIAGRMRGDHVRIEVWDTGAGISPAEERRIFEEFQRGSASERPTQYNTGFGLGLSIVQRMAEVLGHKVEVCSKPGHGSRFSILTPYAGRAAKHPNLQPAAQAGQVYGFSSAKVVVLDNEVTVLEAMQSLLDRWSCDVRYARDLDDLKRVISEPRFRPDIVLADYHLERGECGLEAVEWLRSASSYELPAVIITADHSDTVSDAVRRENCEILYKPVKPAELRALMQHLLR